MADEMVRRAQQFINRTYVPRQIPGIDWIEENGQTSWTVMYALTRCLQYELGISPTSDAFGPATPAALQARWPVIDEHTEVPANVVRIIQSALYCKGYDGGVIEGGQYTDVIDSVRQLKANAGVDRALPGSGMVPKLFKALLTMDPYVVVNGGSHTVRSIQQWMNHTYINRRNFFIIPCDGHFSRDVQKALMLAIQFEIGMSDDVANGVFGPGTQAGLRAQTLTRGSYGRWVELFSAAMVFNKRPSATYTFIFDSALEAQVREFQAFVALPVTGLGDYQTWASLLVSTGDPTRRGSACDCVTEITPARARTLRDQGYRVVGRYLSNVPRTTLNKKIQAGELATITAHGLRVFPIYQTWGGSVSYFSAGQGTADALAAMERARHYGFKGGTRIYFAVDFDALDHQVASNIIPHFRAIKATMDRYAREYPIGIYGPRNVCSRAAAEGLTSASFVSGMSTGFSGNLGYPLPPDWAFDQISTIALGSGDGAIEIDNNISSGRDQGQSSFNNPADDGAVDVPFDMTRRDVLLKDVQAYLESRGIPESGGSVGEDLIQFHTTTYAVDLVLAHDALITGLAQALGMRKALIQVPLLWEVRKYNSGDEAADAGVEAYHTSPVPVPGNPLIKRDSSTGLGQIFAATAIGARNYLIDLNLLREARKDTSRDEDIWEVWQKLRRDPAYNIEAIAHVLIHNADLVDIPRPNLRYDREHTRLVLRRYRGTGDAAERDSHIQLGLYETLEKHNAPLRA